MRVKLSQSELTFADNTLMTIGFAFEPVLIVAAISRQQTDNLEHPLPGGGFEDAGGEKEGLSHFEFVPNHLTAFSAMVLG
jgi:hypothetical protein